MPIPHRYADFKAEESGQNTLYFVLFLEAALLLFFIGLGVATLLLDKHEIVPLLLFMGHVILFLDAFHLLRKYRSSLHKGITADRSLENISRVIGGFLVLVFDLFSLILAVLDKDDYHNHAVWISTLVFWSSAALSSIVYMGVAVAYGTHQQLHTKSKELMV